MSEQTQSEDVYGPHLRESVKKPALNEFWHVMDFLNSHGYHLRRRSDCFEEVALYGGSTMRTLSSLYAESERQHPR